MAWKTSNIVKWSLSVLAAAVLLWFTFRGVKWSDFVSLLGKCRWAMVALSMLAGAVAMILRALRWRLLLLQTDARASRLKCIDGVNIGKLADFVFPHLGEIVRCGYVTSPRLKFDMALGTVVMERAWDLLVLVLLCGCTLALKWGQFGDFVTQKILAPSAGGLHRWLVWGVLGALALIVLLVAFVPAVRRFFAGIWQGIKSCLRMRRKWEFLAYTVALWGMYLMMSLLVIWALPMDYGLGVADALFVMLVGSVAGIVPVPGGFGAFHYMVALALSTVYGIPFDTGIVFATLSHESQAVTMALCGAVSYVIETVRRPASSSPTGTSGQTRP